MRHFLRGLSASMMMFLSTQALCQERFSNGKKSFEAAFSILKEKYLVEGVSADELYRAATQGLVKNLDPKLEPWHELLTPQDLAVLMGELTGKISGIGIMLDFRDESGVADISHVISGTPASRGGLKRGDRILRVNGNTYKGKTLQDMVQDVRGKQGEATRLTILRDAEILEKTIKREEIGWNNVDSAVLPQNVGLVAIHSFTDVTPKQLEEALKRLTSAKVGSLVVDLRGNSGGSLDRAEQAIEMLIPKGGTVVQIKQRGGKKRNVIGKREPYLAEIPLAVLIDHETESSGEIMASALRRERKAVLVGSTTKGKWTVQRVEELPNGYAIKYTVGVFGEPNGTIAVDAPGIAPEIPVTLPEGESASSLQRLEPIEKRLELDSPLKSALEILRKR